MRTRLALSLALSLLMASQASADPAASTEEEGEVTPIGAIRAIDHSPVIVTLAMFPDPDNPDEQLAAVGISGTTIGAQKPINGVVLVNDVSALTVAISSLHLLVSLIDLEEPHVTSSFYYSLGAGKDGVGIGYTATEGEGGFIYLELGGVEEDRVVYLEADQLAPLSDYLVAAQDKATELGYGGPRR